MFQASRVAAFNHASSITRESSARKLGGTSEPPTHDRGRSITTGTPISQRPGGYSRWSGKSSKKIKIGLDHCRIPHWPSLLLRYEISTAQQSGLAGRQVEDTFQRLHIGWRCCGAALRNGRILVSPSYRGVFTSVAHIGTGKNDEDFFFSGSTLPQPLYDSLARRADKRPTHEQPLSKRQPICGEWHRSNQA